MDYKSTCEFIQNKIKSNWENTRRKQLTGKQAAYLSMEFLMGRMIHNNLFALKINSENNFEDIDDAALGNGGLGRLAACFLDSAATHSIPLTGYGIRYKYGLFKQLIEDGYQVETADDWTASGDFWGIRKEDEKQLIKYSDGEVWAVPYDYPIIGYDTDYVGTLRLFKSESTKGFDFKTFDSGKFADASRDEIDAEAVSAVLYPNDNTYDGIKLRLRQQYFFSCASVKDLMQNANDFVIQLNDTHPVIAIPTFISLCEDFETGFEKAKQIFNYTNHTVMPEALEKWDSTLIDELLPDIYKIIIQISEKLLCELYRQKADKKTIESMKIIKGGKVHMANLASYVCGHINGVAEIHSELLKSTVLKDFYEFSPEKFQNKTNGITQRRWLGLCNPLLTEFYTELSGSDKFLTDLSELKKIKYNNADLNRFIEIKQENKRRLIEKIGNEKINLTENFIFDIQIKRLHEYKRQLLNAFSIMYIYFGIKDGSIKNFHPTAFIFGAKSAPGYRRAKGIIKYINEIAKLIENDDEVKDLIKVIFVENYNVSYAEVFIPAADVSEQISPAGTEASGTGNMKLSLNGAVTLGTMDGANIEIFAECGVENNYVFGKTVDEIEEIVKDGYDPREILAENEKIRRVVQTLIDGTVSDGGTWGSGEGSFRELYYALTDGTSWHKPDHYFLLSEFEDYVDTKLRLNADYASDRLEFAKKQFENSINSGVFSSDRTVKQYAREIWELNTA
ncbi:MAG: glycogen/starch/alpha-glucan family phosphorylase [Ruminococcus sp.]|jgi:starch phosphorylase|nr:glycogen/starch/alpha-glucan family phosphorylase [Ruminococcus sp.]